MSQGLSQQLILLPILLPLLCGTLLILLNETRHQLKFLINFSSVITMGAAAIVLMEISDSSSWPGPVGVYLAANWSAPFGITLVVDRLSALLLLLTATIGSLALLYAMSRWSRIGVHFHSLFQFMLMGINGAFLTHDLFNLFVFFEVMLAASYGLLLHGYNINRIRAGMLFIAINLLASLCFLIGIALIYATSGTLNMSDLALRITQMQGTDLQLLKTGSAIMAIAFLIKSAMWPLGFWLPATYTAASPPVAAMLALMTKVGIYVILRIWSLVFSGQAGAAAGFWLDVLYWGGIATIIYGAAGMLANDLQGKLAGYAAIISSGTLLAIIGYGDSALTPSALFYLLSSTLAMAAFLLLIELIDRSRNPIEALLLTTKEAFQFEETPDQPVGISIPAGSAFLGLSFAASALIIAGLPPLSGFIAKFSLFHALLGAEPTNDGIPATGITLLVLIILSGLAAIIALMKFGIRTFWASGSVKTRLQITEILPITLLLTLCLGLAIKAAPVFDYLQRASLDLHRPTLYTDSVFNSPVRPGAAVKESNP